VRILETDPNNTGALNDAGLAAAELGETIKAVECFEKALLLEAGNQPAFFNLIDLLVREDASDLAFEVFAANFQSMPYSEELREYANVLMAAKSADVPAPAGFEGTFPEAKASAGERVDAASE
jgi:tetratricopeptide (TPR) repeat protein